MYGNSQHILFCTKMVHFLPKSKPGREGAIVCTMVIGWMMALTHSPACHPVFF